MDSQKYVTNGQNNIGIRCLYCNCSILSLNSAYLLNGKYNLPNITQKKDLPPSEVSTEEICDWWVVDNMFTFENIGVTHTVGTTKYLSCADCEAGPLGYHDIPSQKNYIALSRVKHA